MPVDRGCDASKNGAAVYFFSLILYGSYFLVYFSKWSRASKVEFYELALITLAFGGYLFLVLILKTQRYRLLDVNRRITAAELSLVFRRCRGRQMTSCDQHSQLQQLSQHHPSLCNKRATRALDASQSDRRYPAN